MNITIVAGTRPNFIKIAPIISAIKSSSLAYRLVHTGQHYDEKMSGSFFKELNIPQPDINLNCHSGKTQTEQIASIMVAFEKELIENPTDLVIVVGDVNSTMACAITAKKLKIPVAHVEAGIRSFDHNMPEEINRIVTDSISDYFFTTTTSARDYLIKSGFNKDNIFFVGNVMIDTLLEHKNNAKKPDFFDSLNLTPNNYVVLTLHRPSNVDEYENLISLLNHISKSCENLPIIFPIHPRTEKIIQQEKFSLPNLYLVPPQSYLNFIYLVKNATLVITDSGGITEETTILNVPCITIRENTERPETISLGTNVLVGNNIEKLNHYISTAIQGKWHNSKPIELWDGKVAERIVKILEEL